MKVTHAITGLLLVLVAAGTATAQGVAPEVSMSLSGLPTEPLVLRDNGTQSFTLKVTVEAGNFICTGEGVIPVEVTGTSDLGGIDNLTFEPNPAPFQVPPGVYQAGDYNETQDVTVTFSVMGKVPANHSHAVDVRAAFAGGDVENCHASAAFPAAEAQGAFTADLVYTPPATNSTGPTNVEGEGGGIPAPGLPLVLAGAGLAARWLRRD